MAEVTFFSAVNMSAVPTSVGTLNNPTPSSFTISGLGSLAVYDGSFTYSGNSVSGSITSVTAYSGGVITEQISGLSLDAATVALDAKTAQTAALQALEFRGSDNISVLAGNSTVLAYGGNDQISLAGGGNVVDGGVGINTVAYSGYAQAYAVSVIGGSIIVGAANSGTVDTLINVERIKFADVLMAYDANGNLGEAYRLYSAAFNRAPDQPGLSFWISQLDQGASPATVAQNFATSAEFKALYGGSPSASELVTALYMNVLGRAPDLSGFAYWTNKVLGGMSESSALLAFSNSAENIHKVAPVLLQGVALDPTLTYA